MDIFSFINEHKEIAEIVAPIISSLIGTFIGGIGVFYTVFRKAKITQKRLLVQTISEERIKWINDLRDEFVEFNKNLLMYQEIKANLKDNIEIPEEIKRYEYLISSIYKITLMLNPSEYYMNYLIIKINELLQVLSTLNGDYSMDAYIKSREEMKDLQQIILKSEWKRVKEESSKGNELSSKKVNNLYNEIAKSINSDVCDFVNDWIQMEKDSKKMTEEKLYEKHFG